MRKKHSYRSIDVEKFELSKLLPALSAGCVVAFDVAKTKYFLALATLTGEVLGILHFEHPKQTSLLLELLVQLKKATAGVQVVLEPTGSYGDWLQEHANRLGCEVWMVPSKFTHDSAEMTDGVPSMHDAKAAVTLVELHTNPKRKSKRWQPASAERRDFRAQVDESNIYWSQLMPLYGRLEAMLARYWPEFGKWIDVYSQKSWMSLLIEMPGPKQVSDRAQESKTLLRKAGRGALKAEKINGLVDSASKSFGLPMTAGEQKLLQLLVKQIQALRQSLEQVGKQLAHQSRSDTEVNAMGEVVGMPTAAVLFAMVGRPSSYPSAAAYEKGYGLNLKIRSSGNYKGQLRITKRGSAMARHRMYLAAMRFIASNAAARAWYENRGGYKAECKTKAVVALMRKLVKALWHVAQGKAFDVSKLFDLKKLKISDAPNNAKNSATKKSKEANSKRAA